MALAANREKAGSAGPENDGHLQHTPFAPMSAHSTRRSENANEGGEVGE